MPQVTIHPRSDAGEPVQDVWFIHELLNSSASTQSSLFLIEGRWLNLAKRADTPAHELTIGFLFAIENALRELIIENLSKIGGPQWYKSRLPGDVLEKYREGIAAQRKAKWASLTFHHPIYYTDFPDLKKIIESKSNWEGAFKEIFTRKEILISTLSEIEEIRNSVAHNRKITAHDFKLVEAAAHKLATMIGAKMFTDMAGRSTAVNGLVEQALFHLKRAREIWAERKTSSIVCLFALRVDDKKCDLVEVRDPSPDLLVQEAVESVESLMSSGG